MLSWLRRHPHYFQIILSLAILTGSLLITALLIITKASPEKSETESPIAYVKTFVVKPSNEKITIVAYGSVEAEQELLLTSEVGGKIIEQLPELKIGGILKKNNLLLQIDPRDYEAHINQERAAVVKAEFELNLEEGKSLIAEREWNLLNSDENSTVLGKELALRKPQLRDKNANVLAAKSQLKKAEINLERTFVRCPFNAVVLSEGVEVGQILNANGVIATLASTDSFRIKTSIAYSKLPWILLPKNQEKGAKATIFQELGQGITLSRTGYVDRILSNLSTVGRMVRVIITIDDPLSLEEENYDKDKILMGGYVRVEIEGPLIENAFVIPRAALRENQSLWLNKNNKLHIQPVHIAIRNRDTLVVDQGLEEGDEVITSNLSTPLVGMAIESLKLSN